MKRRFICCEIYVYAPTMKTTTTTATAAYMVYELIKPFHLSFGWIICRLFQFYHAWFFVSVSEHDIKRSNGKTRRTIWNMNRIQIKYEWDIFIYDLPEILIVARELKTRLRNEIGDRCLSKCGKESENNFSSPPTKNISLNANYTSRIYRAAVFVPTVLSKNVCLHLVVIYVNYIMQTLIHLSLALWLTEFFHLFSFQIQMSYEKIKLQQTEEKSFHWSVSHLSVALQLALTNGKLVGFSE